MSSLRPVRRGAGPGALAGLSPMGLLRRARQRLGPQALLGRALRHLLKPSLALARRRRFARQLAQWRLLQRLAQAVPAPRDGRRVLILASDPQALVGSKGDEAMVRALIAALHARAEPPEIGLFCSAETDPALAHALGCVAVPGWNFPFSLRRSWAAMRAYAPSELLLIGADALDGHYAPQVSASLLMLADLAARGGLPSRVSGFSFNAAPDPALAEVFDGLSPALQLNVRDAVSLARLRAFSRVPARLVADVAFLLRPEPGPALAGLRDWVGTQRERARCVLALNLHPMLLHRAAQARQAALLDSVAAALRPILREQPLAVVLVSHDQRSVDGDARCLQGLAARLLPEFADRLYLLDERCGAAEVKAAMALVDAVLTGRMHLAVAALGQGVPVAVLAYQGKFEGLLQWFELPPALCVAPEHLLDPQHLAQALGLLLAQRDALAAQVQARLPAVMAAAALNLPPQEATP